LPLVVSEGVVEVTIGWPDGPVVPVVVGVVPTSVGALSALWPWCQSMTKGRAGGARLS
jgi:hypothetical protein